MSRLNRLNKRKLKCLLATKHDGSASDDDAVERLYGFMEGSVLTPEGFDLTAPVLEDQTRPRRRDRVLRRRRTAV